MTQIGRSTFGALALKNVVAQRGQKIRLLLALPIALTLSMAYDRAEASARKYVPSPAVVKRDKGPVFKQGCLVYTARVTSPPCRFGKVGSKKKMVVFGDSHAMHWTPALIKVAQRRGWEMIVLTRASCKVPLVDISPVCNRWRANAFKRIRREKPGLVFVASSAGLNTIVKQNGKRIDRQAGEPILRRGMRKTLQRLMKMGAKITVMRGVPVSVRQLPPDCIRQNRANPGRCAFPADRSDSLAYGFQVARTMKRVQILDPLPKVCPGGRCRVVEGRIIKYRDRSHLSATYVQTLDRWFHKRLRNPFPAVSRPVPADPVQGHDESVASTR